MKKISLITKYSEIEDLFWKAGILQRCGFYDFCPIFDFYREKFGAKKARDREYLAMASG